MEIDSVESRNPRVGTIALIKGFLKPRVIKNITITM